MRAFVFTTAFYLSAFVVVGAGLAGCNWRQNLGTKHAPQPNVLVLMVENLGFNAFSCGDSNGPPDDVLFENFCDESVRFTHAYTPSLMSQATIASLLTGLYPLEHGVRNNGADFLSAKYQTVAEVARDEQFHTSFISGGPPVFRSSGFNQGFEVFDDNIGLSSKSLYRPASNVVNMFLEWQKATPRFFSFLFFSDAQFVDQPTTDDLGEVRESSYEGQIAEVSESIESLVKEMKRRHIWDSTTVILVGVNGASENRGGQPGAVDLFSESVRTVLMVKPAQNANPDYVKPSNWKIDANVSLVDLGKTLYELAAGPGTRATITSKMDVVSLTSSFADPKPNWPEDRNILIESAWAEWRKVGSVRSSVRSGPYFYLFDENDQIFNTLTDNLEHRSLPLGEPAVSRLRDHFAQVLRDYGYEPWHITKRSDLERTMLGEDLWRDRPASPETIAQLRTLTRRYREDVELTGWRAQVDLQRGDWNDLKVVAGHDHPLWAYVADMNLGTAKIPPLEDPCFKNLFTHAGERGKDCSDELARALALSYDDSRPKSERERAADIFNKLELAKSVSDRVARANLAVGDTWDVSRGRWAEPSVSDLMLALPIFKKAKAKK